MKDPHQEDSSHHQEDGSHHQADRHRQPHCWVSFLAKVRCLSLPLCRGSEKAQSVENMHTVTAFVLITFLTAETQIPEKGRVCLVRGWQWYSPFWKGSNWETAGHLASEIRTDRQTCTPAHLVSLLVSKLFWKQYHRHIPRCVS